MTAEIGRLLKQVGKQDCDTTIMKVVSVDKQNGTCVCNDGTIDHTDVRLTAIIDEQKQKFHLFPKVGSTVLVTPINNSYTMQFVSAVGEVEELVIGVGNSFLTVTSEGFLLKKENETLKQLMLDLLKAIKAMRFTTNNGPTIQLINAPEFTALENRFQQFLKDN